MSAPFYEQRVQPTGMPAARTPDVRVSANPDAFGAGRARDMAAFGQQLQQTMEYIQQKRNEALVQDEMNQLREETHNWMAGIQQRRGKDALFSQDETRKHMESLIKRRSEHMKNPVQQRMFRQMSEQVRLQADEAALNHQGRETFRYSVQTAEASAQLAIEEAARNPEAIGDRMEELSAAVFKKAELLGASGEERQVMYQQARTELHSQVAQVMAAEPGGGRKALDHIEKYAEEMNPTVVAKFKAQFKGQADREDAYSTALGLVQKSPNQLAALDEARKLPPEKAKQVEAYLMRLYANRAGAARSMREESSGELSLTLFEMQRDGASWEDVEKAIMASDIDDGMKAVFLENMDKRYAAVSDQEARAELHARQNAAEVGLITAMYSDDLSVREEFMNRDLSPLASLLEPAKFEKFRKAQRDMQQEKFVPESDVHKHFGKALGYMAKTVGNEALRKQKSAEAYFRFNRDVVPKLGQMTREESDRAVASIIHSVFGDEGSWLRKATRPQGVPQDAGDKEYFRLYAKDNPDGSPGEIIFDGEAYPHKTTLDNGDVQVDYYDVTGKHVGEIVRKTPPSMFRRASESVVGAVQDSRPYEVGRDFASHTVRGAGVATREVPEGLSSVYRRIHDWATRPDPEEYQRLLNTKFTKDTITEYSKRAFGLRTLRATDRAKLESIFSIMDHTGKKSLTFDELMGIDPEMLPRYLNRRIERHRNVD